MKLADGQVSGVYAEQRAAPEVMTYSGGELVFVPCER